MGEIAFLTFRLRLVLVRGGIGCVADVRPRVEPVVRANGDGHQTEGGESAHGGQQRLNPAVTPSHDASCLSTPVQRVRTGARQGADAVVSLSPPPPLSPYLSLSLLSRIFNPMPKLSVAVKMTKTLQLSSPQTLHTGLKRTVKPLGPLMPWLGLLRPVQFPFSIFPSFFLSSVTFPSVFSRSES